MTSSSQGLVATGTRLYYANHGAVAFKEVANVKTTPEIGATPQQIEITNLDDVNQRYAMGMGNVPMLAFTVVYKGPDWNTIYSLAGNHTDYDWKLVYPDGMYITFTGPFQIQLEPLDVNTAATYNLSIAPNDIPKFHKSASDDTASDSGEGGESKGSDSNMSYRPMFVKSFDSVADMNAYDNSADDVIQGDFVLINSTDGDRGKVYFYNGKGFTFFANIVGPQGIKGDKGDPGLSMCMMGKEASLPALAQEGSFCFVGTTLYSYTNGKWINLGDFKGDKGDQGIQGKQGIQGVPGEVQLKDLNAGLATKAGLTGNNEFKGNNKFDSDPVDKNGVAYITDDQLAPNLIQESTDSPLPADGVKKYHLNVVKGNTYHFGITAVGDTVNANKSQVCLYLGYISDNNFPIAPMGNSEVMAIDTNYDNVWTATKDGQLQMKVIESTSGLFYKEFVVTQTNNYIPYAQAEVNKHAQNGVDKTEDLIGGRNLLINTANPSSSNQIAVKSGIISVHGNLTYAGNSVTLTSKGEPETYYRFIMGPIAGTNIQAGKTYTLSGYLNGDTTLNIHPRSGYATSSSGWQEFVAPRFQILSNTTDQYFNYTFSLPIDATSVFTSLQLFNSSNQSGVPVGGSFSFSDIMLQEGTVPTGNSPAPEDLQAYTDNAVASLAKRVAALEAKTK